MNLKTKLAAAMVFAASASVAQASTSTYNVAAVFGDGGVQGQTVFNGSFDWDGTSVTNFSGLLSESMWEWNTTSTPNMFSRTMMNGSTQYETVYGSAGKNYETGIYSQGDAPLLALNYQLDNSLAVGSGLHAVSVFLKGAAGVADTRVFMDGSYDASVLDVDTGENISTKFGDATTRNWNAMFTLVFDAANPLNTASVLNSMQYADCNQLGMMGQACMTGVTANGLAGSMGGAPSTLSITEVAAVPVPAAAWLFGGALMSLFGASRRKSVMPA